MSDQNLSTEALRDLLLNKGVKPSVQRMSVLRYVMEKKSHPSVDEIYKSLVSTIPTLSKTTVYNTLKHLAELGLINTLSIDDVQVKYDFVEDKHAHFMCTSCSKIYDVKLEPQFFNPDLVNGHQVI